MGISSRLMTTIAIAGAILTGQPALAQAGDIHRGFEEAGFTPASTLRQRGVESFRIWIHDPYFMMGTPAVEVLRGGNTIKVTAAYATMDEPRKLLWTKPLEPLTIQQWDALKLAEARIQYDARPQRSPSFRSGYVCHGWAVELETGPDRADGWWGCSSKLDDPKYVFADLLAKELLKANPKCVKTGKFSGEFESFWEFTTCFGPRDQLDDVELEAKRAVLVDRWNDIYKGQSDLLLAARQLMRQIERQHLPLGGPLWRDAKVAAERVRANNEKLSKLAIDAYQVSKSKKSLSDADRVRLDGWINDWNYTLRAQENNYSNLLQNLVDARLP